MPLTGTHRSIIVSSGELLAVAGTPSSSTFLPGSHAELRWSRLDYPSRSRYTWREWVMGPQVLNMATSVLFTPRSGVMGPFWHITGDRPHLVGNTQGLRGSYFPCINITKKLVDKAIILNPLVDFMLKTPQKKETWTSRSFWGLELSCIWVDRGQIRR